MRTEYVSMKFKGMRKEQIFIIYPCSATDNNILIQSDQRIGRVDFEKGQIYLSKGRSSGSYGPDLCEARGAKLIDLTPEQLETLKEARLKMSGETNPDGTVTLIG